MRECTFWCVTGNTLNKVFLARLFASYPYLKIKSWCVYQKKLTLIRSDKFVGNFLQETPFFVFYQKPLMSNRFNSKMHRMVVRNFFFILVYYMGVNHFVEFRFVEFRPIPFRRIPFHRIPFQKFQTTGTYLNCYF